MIEKRSPVPVPTITASCMTSDVRIAVDAMLSATGLPAPSVVVHPDVAHVTVNDPDDLALWLGKLGGEVHRYPPREGVAMWTLWTFSPVRGDGTQIPINVHAIVVEGEDVLDEVVRAVAA